MAARRRLCSVGQLYGAALLSVRGPGVVATATHRAHSSTAFNGQHAAPWPIWTPSLRGVWQLCATRFDGF